MKNLFKGIIIAIAIMMATASVSLKAEAKTPGKIDIPVEIIDDEPQEPEEPEIPETPQEPEEPEVPETPQEPEEPEIPETPQEPEEPEVPETPQEPEKPEVPEMPQTPISTEDIIVVASVEPKMVATKVATVDQWDLEVLPAGPEEIPATGIETDIIVIVMIAFAIGYIMASKKEATEKIFVACKTNPLSCDCVATVNTINAAYANTKHRVVTLAVKRLRRDLKRMHEEKCKLLAKTRRVFLLKVPLCCISV